MGVTHIAGQNITVMGRYVRQRCSWCGAVLVDDDLACVMVPEGSDRGPFHFPVGRLVRVEGNVVRHFHVLPDDERLPADSCALAEVDQREAAEAVDRLGLDDERKGRMTDA